MIRAERETVIIANLGDLDEGFFLISTTEPGVLARLKRLAASRLIIEAAKNAKGREVSWEIRVPADLWRGSALRVARRRTLSEESKALRSSNLNAQHAPKPPIAMGEE
jgi:hypothetical protein